jgi:hypothetical protein
MGSTAPIDDAVLGELRDRAATHPLVERVEPDRTGGTLSTVVLVLDSAQYPERVSGARLDIRWYTNGDYSFHYVETHGDGDRWQCRWDQHPNPHTSRTHFHPPPDARSEDAVPDHPDETYPDSLFSRTLANVRGRIADCWDGDQT